MKPLGDELDEDLANSSIPNSFNLEEDFDTPDMHIPSQPKSLGVQLDMLTDTQRLKLFSSYCMYCGSKNPLCKCKENGKDKATS